MKTWPDVAYFALETIKFVVGICAPLLAAVLVAAFTYRVGRQREWREKRLALLEESHAAVLDLISAWASLLSKAESAGVDGLVPASEEVKKVAEEGQKLLRMSAKLELYSLKIAERGLNPLMDWHQSSFDLIDQNGWVRGSMASHLNRFKDAGNFAIEALKEEVSRVESMGVRKGIREVLADWSN